MPLLQDRVQETSTTTGTGTLTLAGAVTGYRSFNASFTNGDVVFYTIDDALGNWEVGSGTVGTGTLTRATVIVSSNANALVNFGAGAKRVFCSAPTQALLPNQTGNSGKYLTTDGTSPSWSTVTAGTVTSVSGTGTVSGLTLSGTVTTSGSLTLGGTLNLSAYNAAGAFTTLSASSTVSGTGFSTYLASPPAIGGTAAAAVSSTNLSYTGTLTGGTGVIAIGTNQIYKDAAGNVGIGTSSPGRKLHLYATGTCFKLESSSTNVYFQLACNGQTNAQSGYIGYNSTSDLLFLTNDAERMRIDSSGNLLVGTTSVYNLCKVSILGYAGIATQVATTNASTTYVGRDTSGNATFYVLGSGNIYSTSTSITAISDISLKENIRPLETGLSEVLALKPRRFDWKNGDGADIAGFIAQEVVDVLPDLVSDYKYNDEETKKAVKMGDMIPTLVKAIQELSAELNELKQRIN